MGEASYPMSQGSAPVAIVLALALAATVGVSAQSWDLKVAAKQAGSVARPGGEAGTAAATDEDAGHPLLRMLADSASDGRTANCPSSAR